jgi:hypothetical protein
MTFEIMTEPLSPARNRLVTGWAEPMLLALILLAAAAIRIHAIDFGLPDLNDPDEPLFMMTAVDMLRGGTLNPGWFGHPATITFYSICLVTLAVGGLGIATGRFANIDGFVGAVYADPGILIVPTRLFFAACGVACVWLTYLIGKRLGDARMGLTAAALLALSAVHVEYSQLVRTDVQMSVFMLLCTLSSIAIARTGRARDHALAGVFLGLGIATKWPAAVIALSPLCAALWCRRSKGWQMVVRNIALLGLCGAAALFLASPYLLLDHATVLANLAGEARPTHPGATGGGFMANLLWYARGPLVTAFGTVGLALAALGAALMPLRNRTAAVAVLPGFAALALILCAQSLTWERWVVPLLPFLALSAAWTLGAAADLLRRRLDRPLLGLEGLAATLLLLPMATTTLGEQRERMNDTRQAAASWVRDHVPRGSSILVEHAAFDLLGRGWRLRFPLGAAGCVDAEAALAGRIPHADVEAQRSGPAVDIAYVPPARLASCRADYAIFTRYHIYRDEGPEFAAQRAVYRAIAAGGRLHATFKRMPGRTGGPEVQIWELRTAS